MILMKQNVRRAHTLQQSVSNQGKRKKNAQCMDTAASALSELAKGAASSSKEDDEWDMFGRDDANSTCAIKSEAYNVVQNLLFNQLYFRQQNMQCNSRPPSLQQLQIYIPSLIHMKDMALITITFSLLLVS